MHDFTNKQEVRFFTEAGPMGKAVEQPLTGEDAAQLGRSLSLLGAGLCDVVPASLRQFLTFGPDAVAPGGGDEAFSIRKDFEI